MMIAKSVTFLFLLFAIVGLSATAFAQQTDQALYRGLYDKGEYDKAAIVLKRLTKQNSADGDAWFYLGRTYLATDKFKEATKAFEKAAAVKPGDALVHAALAYVLLLRNDSKASGEAVTTLKLDPNNADAHYVLGVVSMRNASYNEAYERAKKAIEINPQLAAAYLLRSQALVSSFALQSGTIVRPKSARNVLIQEAAQDLEKYISLMPKNSSSDRYAGYLESLKFFAEYYNRPESPKPNDVDDPKPGSSTITPIKVLFKPRANYTNRAREAGVSGTIRLLAGCSADGKIKHVMVIKPLGYGLDEEAINAARQIKFEPKKEDGKPVSTVIILEYGFTIY